MKRRAKSAVIEVVLVHLRSFNDSTSKAALQMCALIGNYCFVDGGLNQFFRFAVLVLGILPLLITVMSAMNSTSAHILVTEELARPLITGGISIAAGEPIKTDAPGAQEIP